MKVNELLSESNGSSNWKSRIPESKFIDDASSTLSSKDQDSLNDDHSGDLVDFLESKGAIKKTITIPQDIVPHDGAFHFEFTTWNYKGKTFSLGSGEEYNDEVYAWKGTYSPADIAYQYYFESLENDDDGHVEKALEYLKNK